eukprot:3914530-Amphidinium_carterae.1
MAMVIMMLLTQHYNNTSVSYPSSYDVRSSSCVPSTKTTQIAISSGRSNQEFYKTSSVELLGCQCCWGIMVLVQKPEKVPFAALIPFPDFLYLSK